MRKTITSVLFAVTTVAFHSPVRAESGAPSTTATPVAATPVAATPVAATPVAATPVAATSTKGAPKTTKPPTVPKPPLDGDALPKLKPCKNPDSEGGGAPSTDCSGVFGLRGGITRTKGAGPKDATSFTISTEGEEYVRRGFWSTRSVYRLAIGGGEAGFDGTLLGGWAWGVRLPVAPCRRHGPVLRVGMYGYIRGNDAYYGSLLELPQLQFGYQYMRGKVVLELGGTAGAVLVGRSRTGDTERRVLGAGYERGGYLAIQFPWVRLGLNGSRLPVNDDWSAPVDVFEGALCARALGMAL